MPDSLSPAVLTSPAPARSPAPLQAGITVALLLTGLGFLGILTPGCRTHLHPSRPAEFPLGLFAVQETNDFPTVRDAGFNLIQSTASQHHLDAARRAGLRVLATPGTPAGSPGFNPTIVTQVVRHFDTHPALWAWYLADEPDLHRVPPSEIHLAGRTIRQTGARKPTALTLFHAQNAPDYAPTTRILMIDRYPIPWMPVADLGKHLRLARFAAHQQPLFAILQAFDWSAYPDLRPSPQPMRAPSLQELRAMSFLARVHGADGLFFYCLNDGLWNLQQHPQVWTNLQRVVAEIRQLEPLFTASRTWRAVGVSYPDPLSRLNEVLDAAIAWTVLRVDPSQANEHLAPGDYLLAVNTTPNNVPWAFSFHPPLHLPVPRNNPPALLPSQAGWYSDHFPPLGVHVYGPLPPADPQDPAPAEDAPRSPG